MKNTQLSTLIIHLKPIYRALLSIIVPIIFLLIKCNFCIFNLLIAWLCFATIYISLCWYTILSMKVSEIIRKASTEDGSKIFVFIFLITGIIGCFIGVLMIILKNNTNDIYHLNLSISIGCIIISWILVHTIFIFHYAKLYYKSSGKGYGIDFPGGEQPDYIDFAYFSFNLACTFQVADTNITSKKIRRVALIHGIIAFALNTYLIALSINIVSSLVN